MLRRYIALATVCALTACGGGGGGTLPSAPSHTVSGQGSATIAFKVPAKGAQVRAHAAKSVTPLYQSPATLGVGMSLVAAGATPPPLATPQIAFDLSTCTATGVTPCTQNADGSRTYTFTSPPVPLGTYSGVISTWDAAPVSGSFSAANELSEGTASVAITGTGTAINVTLNGIPKSISMTAIGGQTHVFARHAQLQPQGQAPATPAPLQPVGNQPTQWSVVALDADGNIIAGNGAPLMSFSDPTGSVSVVQSAPQSSIYTMTASQAQPSSIPLQVTASFTGQNGASTATQAFQVLPLQELWATHTGTGIFGYALDPSKSFAPPTIGLSFPTTFIATDAFATSDSLGSIAEDASGTFWVVDTTTNTISQYAIGNGVLAPTGVSIDTKAPGYVIAGLAGDANGFLYGIDMSGNNLLVWNVSGSSPTLAYTVALQSGRTTPAGVSVIPSGAGVASGLPGLVMVCDSAGIDFYTNAKNGKPTFVSNAAASFGSSGTLGASVAADTGTLWTLETSSGSSTVGLYPLSPGPAVGLPLASAGTHEDDYGYIAAGVGNYGYASDGPYGYNINQYLYTAPSTAAYTNLSISAASTNPYGVYISP